MSGSFQDLASSANACAIRGTGARVWAAMALALLLAGCGDNFVAGMGAPAVGGPSTLEVHRLAPAEGDVLGGELVEVEGAGFLTGAPDAPAIQIAGVDATDVQVVSDTMLTFRAPPGLPGSAAVTLRNANGDVLLPDAFTYGSFPLYAADGKSGVAGNLYRVDPVDGSTTIIGPVGHAVTGLVMSPTGVLYATESTRRGALGDARLLRIDVATGVGSVIGVLVDGVTQEVHHGIADITFFGDRLIGWSQNGDVPVEINTATGRVSVLGPSILAYGAGLAHDGAGTLYLAGQGNDGPLMLVNLETGVSAPGPTLSGGTIEFSSIGALTLHRGRLLGVDLESGRSEETPADLIEIDPDTGAITVLGSLPPGIDALAGSRTLR